MSEHEGIDQQAKIIDETGREKLAHHIAAAEGQEVRTDFEFERANGIGEIAGKRTTVLPFEIISAMRRNVLGYAIEFIGDGAAG